MLKNILLVALLLDFVYGVDSVKPFLNWLQKKGGKFDNVTLKRYPEMGYGVEATLPIRAGDLLMSIPLTSVMCRRTILRLYPLEQRQLISHIEDDGHLIALFLMTEKAKGSASEWYHFINVLPKKTDGALFFTDGELDDLQNKESKKALSFRREKLVAKFKGYELVHYPESFFYEIPDQVEKLGTVEQFQWAISIVNSRAHIINDGTYLVPLADFFNIDLEARTTLQDAAKVYARTHIIEGDQVKIIAAKPSKMNKQIFSDMGGLPNDAYFENYGIVSEKNPYDCVSAALPGIVKEDNPNYDDQVRIARKFKFNEDNPSICIRPSEVLQKSTTGFLIIRTMSAESIQHCRDVLRQYKKIVNETTINKCFFEPEAKVNRTQALQEFVEYLVNGLRVFPTSLEQDQQLMNYPDFSHHKRLAIRYRYSQKLAVVRSIETLTHYLLPHNITQPKQSLQQRINSFYTWFQSYNSSVLKIKPKSFDRMRVGVAATEDIMERQTYISVPKTLVIDAASVKSSQIADVIEAIEKDSGVEDEYHEILFFLLYEKYMNVNTTLTPFLNLLPTVKELNLPLFYTEEELELLKDSLLYDKVMKKRISVQNKYYAMKEAILNIYPQFFPEEVYTLTNFQWASAIVDSRSLFWDEERHLVPMMDLINAKQNPRYVSKTISPIYDLSGDNIELRATWDFEKDEQVFADYGLPNFNLFLFYGFSLEINNNDCYYLPLWIEKTDPRYTEKRQKLIHKGFKEEVIDFCISETSINNDEPFHEYFSLMFDLDMKDKISYHTELHNLLQKRLNDYRTVLAQDEKLLLKEKNPHKREIIRYKMTEKRIAKSLQKYLSNLMEEEI